MKYTTEVDVEEYTLTTIDASFSARITQWISAMSKFADRKANRTLVTGTATTRKFDGSGTTEMLIDEVCGITAITIDGVDVLATALQYPANKTNKYKLSFDTDGFTKGRQNVEVTGKFAMHSATDDNAVADVPDDIRWAVTVLVAGIVNNANRQEDAVKSEKIGQYQVTYNDPGQRKDFLTAMEIIKGYRRVAV